MRADGRCACFPPRQLRKKLGRLQLSNEAVVAREQQREAKLGKVEAPWFIRFPFAVLCWTLDVVYANRPIQRCAARCRVFRV